LLSVGIPSILLLLLVVSLLLSGQHVFVVVVAQLHGALLHSCHALVQNTVHTKVANECVLPDKGGLANDTLVRFFR
jgi:hypothetical protein